MRHVLNSSFGGEDLNKNFKNKKITPKFFSKIFPPELIFLNISLLSGLAYFFNPLRKPEYLASISFKIALRLPLCDLFLWGKMYHIIFSWSSRGIKKSFIKPKEKQMAKNLKIVDISIGFCILSLDINNDRLKSSFTIQGERKEKIWNFGKVCFF